MAYDPTKSTGQGADSIDSRVLGMPFISIIQKGSPEFDETHRNFKTKGIAGCKPGQLLFAPERLILPQPLQVIPVAQTALYTEWKPRDQQGGFVGNQPLSIATSKDYSRGPKGSKEEHKEYLGKNEIIYTIFVMVLFKHGDKWKRGMISFTSTSLKQARAWLKGIRSVRYADLPNVEPPIFAASYLLDSYADNNPKGSWYGWVIKQDRVFDLIKDEELLVMAEKASQDALLTLPSVGAVAQLANGEGDQPY